MTHRNAPLTPEGRKRLVERCRTRPIAHVAAEMGISRATASKWVNRYKQYGELRLHDRSSAPARQPTATPGETVAHRGDAAAEQVACIPHRVLAPCGRHHSQPPHHHPAPSPAGPQSQAVHRPERRGQPGTQTHHREASRAHGPPRREKVRRIPAGGGWRAYGKDSPEAKVVARAKTRGAKTGYVYLH